MLFVLLYTCSVAVVRIVSAEIVGGNQQQTTKTWNLNETIHMNSLLY